ncbi:MAG: thioredoxin family protein [Planctomycetaceae bacterium]
MVTRLVLATLVNFSALSQCAFASEGWYESYEQARQAAEQQHLPLLIHFHASFCGPCRQMDSQVFSQPDVRRQLRQGLVAVDIDVQHRPDVAQTYGATTVPRDIVVYPGQSPETINVGFKSRLAYLDILREVAGRGRQLSPPTGPAVPETTIAAGSPAVEKEQEPVLGLDGFCPVRLMKDRQWVSGLEQITETDRGITYHFSSAEARDEFRRNPRKFTPQNLGCDPITLYKEQQAVVGSIRFGVFFDDQLYLFETAEHRTQFKQEPLKYGRIQHALRVDELKSRRIQ